MENIKTARLMAFKDISEWMNNENTNKPDKNHDIWNVAPIRLNTKRTRRLNAELGLRNINCFNNINNIHRNRK